MNLLFILTGIVAGAGGAALWFAKRIADARSVASEQEKRHLIELSEAKSERSVAEERTKNALQRILELETETNESRKNVLLSGEKLSQATTENGFLKEQLQRQKTEMEALQKKLQAEFENIANRILKERSSEFLQHNEKNIGEILNPLKEKISLFEKKVDEAYDKELRDKISLREEVKKLTDLNTRVSEEANNLTRALKGDVKKQGNWGEVILERVLERSGLTKGVEYVREEVVEGAEGASQRQRPDVIVHLPDNKHVIVDSKVSLVAYERMVSAETDEARDLAAREHVASVKSHVKLLSEKNYQQSADLNAPDFVMLFIPIEASFAAAVQLDPELFSFAWEKKIVIVSPTTLLATLRTIASIWKQENQNRNALEIARLSGSMYDKLVGFAGDLNKVKENIDRAGGSFDEAMKKLQSGAGNVFRTAERIRELGAKSSKLLPRDLTESE
jgi:DNA recombination protein RmuC